VAVQDAVVTIPGPAGQRSAVSGLVTTALQAGGVIQADGRIVCAAGDPAPAAADLIAGARAGMAR
jgi:hypothetical protein